MRHSIRKVIAVVVAAGALSVGGASLAAAATTPVTVPDVTGDTAPTAVEVLEAAGFTNVIVSGPFAHDPDTTVTRTSVSAYSAASASQPITVFAEPWRLSAGQNSIFR
ncbi:PASTA domain-containing protein [Rhodococcus sp. PAMC28707]|uniref:PASTA domain-containing protein n=1 Tax=unclassified Rhodococcus (in: high G+C Gram-positive bacteria) TaxID=192944 RepID=UPI00109E137F|nr:MULTISPECIES: PASTA domain-containing protein [unclassified Rhodococcus (in: high G+C Gram-positive bacteria)]QCB50455.1 PASTA domain-containing protein [Rhodococcus sp. PAMC28705]QCB57853.1 PASTA domain-containing protein [Rhodococcus sp. PAMC28707]